ncbi:hypothetical protein [Helicobacter sp. T3_23-1056]
MKKLFYMMLLCCISSVNAEPPTLADTYSCTKSGSTKQSVAETSFMQNPIKYYKRWALAHCLKYTSSVDKTMSSGCGKKMPQEIINLAHIDNMTRLLGNEPLSELKTYMEKYYSVAMEYEHKGYINACFDLVYENKEFDAEVERIVKKYCKECE